MEKDNLNLPSYDGFKRKLKEEIPTSASSYFAYVKKAVETLLESNYDLVDKLSSVNDKDELAKIKGITLMELEDCNSLTKNVKSNLKSALRRYFSYLESCLPKNLANESKIEGTVNPDQDSAQHTSELKKSSKLKRKKTPSYDSDNFITYQELFNAFKSRLRTDDRFQRENMFIPMRLINQIMRNSDLRDKYEEWIKTLIDNIIILTSKGAVHLKNIEGIKIKRPYLCVYFKLDNAEPSKLYTYAKSGGSIEPIMTFKIRRKDGNAYNLEKDEIITKLSREHFPECSLIALRDDSQFKALPIITNICVDNGIYNGTDLVKAMSNNDTFNNAILTKVNVNDLYYDINLINLYQSVTLMDSSLNIGKGGTKTKDIK